MYTRGLCLVWVSAIALGALLGCGDDDDQITDAQLEAKAAEALSRAMHFSGGKLRDGAMGLATEDRVEALPESEQVVRPGVAGLLPLTVDNPIADENATAAVLLQFGEDDQHLRVPQSESVDGPGDLNLEFELDDDLCDGLCNSQIEVHATIGLELDDGAISKHHDATITVDCSKRGDANACPHRAPGSGRDGGTAAGSGGKSGSVSVDPASAQLVSDLFDAADGLSAALCACLPAGIPQDTCVSAGPLRDCEEQAVLAEVESSRSWFECARTFFEDQVSCVQDAACDTDALSACTAQLSGSSGDSFSAIEADCGPAPGSLPEDFAACDSSYSSYTCADGEQVTDGVRCDGYEDCSDGSDELGCGSGVGGSLSSFPCSDGSTLDPTQVCDGKNDCSDGSDELVCIDCADGSGKYSAFNLCDGKDQCADGSDEQSCMYPCLSGDQMISVLKVCDGTPDCADGSDESLCGSSEFQCVDGSGSVPFSNVCDGTDDCADGSDEASGLCGT